MSERTVFIVTGASRGIGKALAHALARRDRDVLIVGRDEATLRDAARGFERIDFLRADIATQTGRDLIVTRLQGVDRIDGLIHNAGIIEPIMPLAQITGDAWRQVMATNLDAPLFLTQALLPQLNGGRVLHVGSGAAYFPISSWGAYCISKAALSMLTRCWQVEVTSTSFASVMPGIVDTEMQRNIRNSSGMEADKHEFFMRLKANNQLVSAETVGLFLTWVLLDTDKQAYAASEWDIYHKTHQDSWLVSPHQVPSFDES